MSKSSVNREKVREYAFAIMHNPKFFDWASARYGSVGNTTVTGLALGPLVKAITSLDAELTEAFPYNEEEEET